MTKEKKCSCCFKINPDPKGKAEAIREAKAALAKMKTPGWKIETWHNINWCWHLRNRYITVMPGFWALMDDKLPASGGQMYWTPQNKCFRDPNKAVMHVLEAAARFAEHVTYVVGNQRDALRGLYAKFEERKQ